MLPGAGGLAMLLVGPWLRAEGGVIDSILLPPMWDEVLT